MKAILGLAMAAALIIPTQAGSSIAPPSRAGSAIIQVEGGCGPGFHRNPEGYCRPNFREREREEWNRERRFERLECPRGFHLGPEGRRCWPN